MNDRDLLDLLAKDAPPVRPDFTTEVMQMSRRARLKRRRAALVTAACLAAAGTAVIAVTPWAHDGHDRGQLQTPVTPSAAPDPGTGPYALAIKTLVAQDMSGDAPGTKQITLYVLDHTCPGVDHDSSLTCAGQPLGSGLRQDLTDALRPFAPVHFLSDPKSFGWPPPERYPNNGYLVVLGPVRLEGAQAEVPIALWRGFNNGRGSLTLLTKRSGQWTVGGTPRPGAPMGGWIT